MKKCCMNVFEDSGVLVRIVAIIVTALLALTMSSCETIEESSMSSTDTTDEKDKGDENEGIVIGGDIGNHNTIVFDMGNEKFPDKQVAAIITQAEELAAAGDYDGAISQIQTGLETYSDFESLQKKLEEYEAKRNALIKEETINTTESPAPTEKSAEQIKAEAITAADIQSQHGDNLGAVVTIRMAIEKVGEDAELNELAAAYEKAYQEQLTQQVPETEQETAAPETTEAVAVYANDVLTAFDLDLARTYSEAKNPEGGSFQMSGKEYKNGVVFSVSDSWNRKRSSSISYNIEGNYSKMSFYFGHRDNTGMDSIELKVYLDNKFYESYSMNANDIPQLIEIDVKDKQTIRFSATKGWDCSYCLADLKIE